VKNINPAIELQLLSIYYTKPYRIITIKQEQS